MAFLHDPFGFLIERGARYGRVFRSNVVFRRVVFLWGTEGAEAFFDPANVTRSDAHPFPLVRLFGGTNFEMYDGPKHVALKSMAVRSFDRSSIAWYLPEMLGRIAADVASMAGEDEVRAVDRLRAMAMRAICANLLGLAPGEATDALTRDYATTLAGLKAIPFPVPGTAFGRATAARDRILQRLRAVILDHRDHPKEDGLGRMLAAHAEDGRVYTDEEALLEVHHILIAGFIVYALMGDSMRVLAERPELLERCRDEVARVTPDGPLDVDALDALALCTSVVLEAKRTAPLVPLAFGRAARTFTVGGFEVPEGWTVWLALHLHNRDPDLFANPDRFDPDRFGPGRAEHHRPLAFIPQGVDPPEGHRCLGLDYSTALAVAFLAVLLRGYAWELPAQDLTLDFSKLPAVPRDGLRVRVRPRPTG
jgi:cytochrome P450